MEKTLSGRDTAHRDIHSNSRERLVHSPKTVGTPRSKKKIKKKENEALVGTM